VYNSTPAPENIKNEESVPNYFTTTLLGGIASWIGRGMGIALAFGLTVIAAVVCAPFYFAAKHYQMYQEAKKDVLSAENKITAPAEAATPAAEEKINSRLHTIARSSLKDKGENAKSNFNGKFTFFAHVDRGIGNILPHFLSSEPSFVK
jgi:hypothetical protein